MENSLLGENDVKSQNSSPALQKPSVTSPLPVKNQRILKSQHLESDIASQTPEKKNEPLQVPTEEELGELPERCQDILEFFDRMTCSLRLLSLRQKAPTFRSISNQVEILTGRKFLPRHLAQIKHVLPEALRIEKILVHDEKTLCMKPDMKVKLTFDIVEGHGEESVYIALRDAFASKLKDILTIHPEGTDIPEAELPEPFNQRSNTIMVEPSPVDLSTTTDTDVLSSSHLSPAFSRRLSRKEVTEEDKSKLLDSSCSISSTNFIAVTIQKISTEQPKTFPCSDPELNILNPNCLPCPPVHASSNTAESTPLKVTLENENLMLETPAQLTPKRSAPGSGDKQKNETCNMSAKRSLDFRHLNEEDNSLGLAADEPENCTSGSMLSRIDMRPIPIEDNAILCGSTFSKGLENCYSTGKVQKIRQSDLSNLVLLIHTIFQSVNCRSITKEELIHKIIVNDCDIDENCNVEEQIELLEKLVPDWISKKLVPGGDLLYNINKVSDLNSIRERLISTS